MLSATRRWFRRNRTPIAIGVGVVGAGYVVTQYVLSKINDARERMSSDRIAKENLRRRFEQNQEDCTFTVLALLPTATTNILEAMNTEKITYEIQQMKGSAAAKTRSIGSLSPPTASEAATTDDDGRSTISVSVQSEAGMHTSQISIPPMTPAVSAEGAASEAPQTPQKPRKTKRQLWDDLTISSITRAYTLIYTLGLLAMLTRIQLNLLGRRSYLSSVVSLATGGAQATISLENNDDDGTPSQEYGSDFDVNRKYLTFSWWLLNRGWVDVMQRVEAAVRQVFGHLSPRDTVSLETFSRLTSEVRRRVEGSSPASGGASTQWLPFLLPPASMEDFVLRESGILDDAPADPYGASSAQPSPSSAASLRLLLDETADLIESPAFGQVLAQLLDAAFAVLLTNKLAAGAFEAPPSAELRDPLSGAGYSRAVLLPKVLSVLTRQAHVIGNGMPNEYLQAMEAVRDLEGFAAIVYSSNWQAEIARDGEAQAAAKAPVTETSVLRQSQASGTTAADGESSLVVVDPQASFDSAWEKAVAEQK
ncbi:peroxin-3 [Podospora aff. communis PSN243]|uniref:Peroxin-3 n=1 Tax=Podospora aff. communis PSN243 TaxID=3040156 RepID=A0AAV9GME9_9PEZI|nr:peroxin-3 [Podospora aff. communis PSN243]